MSTTISGASLVNGVSQQTQAKSSSVSKSSDFKKVMAASLAGGASNTSAGKMADKSSLAATVKKADTQANVKKSADKNSSKSNSVNNDYSKNNNDKANQAISNAVNDVKDAIKEELDVTDEDIAKAMEILGMSMNDLLSMAKVTELTGQLTGTDAITLITDESKMSSLSDILDAVKLANQDVADTLGVSLDDASDIIAQNDLGIAINTTSDAEKDAKSAAEQNANAVDANSESLSEQLAKKIVADSSEKNQNNRKDFGAGEQSSVTYGNVADNILSNIDESFADILTEDNGFVRESDIVNQVIDQIKLNANKELTSMEVMLNPERLGSVHITVTARNGVLSAQIAAQNEQVKTALENQMTALKEQFNNQGIKVDAVEVTVMTHSFEAGQNFGQSESERKQAEGSKAHRKLDLSAYEDEIDEDTLVSDRQSASIASGNSSVEYTA